MAYTEVVVHDYIVHRVNNAIEITVTGMFSEDFPSIF